MKAIESLANLRRATRRPATWTSVDIQPGRVAASCMSEPLATKDLQIAALAKSEKNFLTVKNVKLRVNIVMLFVRQPTRKATRAALYATWACRERLFGGHDNVDPAGGSRTIKTPMSQILEPLTSSLGGAA